MDRVAPLAQFVDVALRVEKVPDYEAFAAETDPGGAAPPEIEAVRRYIQTVNFRMWHRRKGWTKDSYDRADMAIETKPFLLAEMFAAQPTLDTAVYLDTDVAIIDRNRSIDDLMASVEALRTPVWNGNARRCVREALLKPGAASAWTAAVSEFRREPPWALLGTRWRVPASAVRHNVLLALSQIPGVICRW